MTRPDRVDTDLDGVPDGCDVCASGDDGVDTDGDTVPDGCDVCAGRNDLADSDGDNVPDGAGSDVDGDGRPDLCDVCVDPQLHRHKVHARHLLDPPKSHPRHCDARCYGAVRRCRPRR